MRPQVSSSLVKRAAEWDELHRWERSELGKDLRRLGLTYGEIRELIPVPKGTLSYWCREIDLTQDQIKAIRARTGPDSRMGILVDTQWRRPEEVERIRERRDGSPRPILTIPCSSAEWSCIGPRDRRLATISHCQTPTRRRCGPSSPGCAVTYCRRLDSSSRYTCMKVTMSSRLAPTGRKQPVYVARDSPRHSSSPRGPGIGRIISSTASAGFEPSTAWTLGTRSCPGSRSSAITSPAARNRG